MPCLLFFYSNSPSWTFLVLLVVEEEVDESNVKEIFNGYQSSVTSENGVMFEISVLCPWKE